MRNLLTAGLVAAALVAAACGDDSTSPSGGGGGSNNGPIAATITISNNTVSPSTVTVAPGSRVTFVNNDTRAHNMNSDPHPEHTGCPEINVGTIAPGQSRTTQNLNTVRTCGFHDHDLPDTASMRGSIRIQ